MHALADNGCKVGLVLTALGDCGDDIDAAGALFETPDTVVDTSFLHRPAKDVEIELFGKLQVRRLAP